MTVGSILGAAFGLVALVGLAVAILLLIGDWGSERANRRVGGVRRGVIAACAVFVVAALISVAQNGFPFY